MNLLNVPGPRHAEPMQHNTPLRWGTFHPTTAERTTESFPSVEAVGSLFQEIL